MKKKKKIRYAVVGLGHIAQVAILPAFRHARENSELVALVSGDRQKLKKLSRLYGVEATYSYGEFEDCLHGGGIDAVYIALPNNMHRDYTIRSARAGVHVLCEKPMAVTEEECEEMIQVCEQNRVKLMIAYRLHFEKTNMKAVQLISSEKIGEARFFSSNFSMPVKDPDNIRIRPETGGGTLYDIGVYCINAARYLFQSEPYEVFAASANGYQEKFKGVDEMTSAIMRFPDERLAMFTASFGSADVSNYQVMGTKGNIIVDPSYSYAEGLKLKVTIKDKTKETAFPKSDQFAPELVYFSDCILKNREPEPSGLEGLADVRVIRALYRSSQIGESVHLDEFRKESRPTLKQEMRKPPIDDLPGLVHVEAPS